MLTAPGRIFAWQQTNPDFTWANASYFNFNTGDTVFFEGIEITLLKVENHFNLIKIAGDTVWMKVSRRSLPFYIGNLRIFVADNKNVKALSANTRMHDLLKKEVLLCISRSGFPLLDPGKFIFPVSFSDGYKWNAEEDNYMFSFNKRNTGNKVIIGTHPGIDFNMHDARGLMKHWIVAIENSTVIWIENKNPEKSGREVWVLLGSASQPGIYYLYKHLYNKNIEVKKGQKLLMGEPIGTIWGDDSWGHLTFSVIKAETAPTPQNCDENVVNCFPQIFELYFQQTTSLSKYFAKGRIFFGKNDSSNGNHKGTSAFEEYSGKGWLLGKWNAADKVDYYVKGNSGNVRLGKTFFRHSNAECTNPNNWFDYEINVKNGIYRIRAKIGDVELPSWQKVSFENVEAGTFALDKNEFDWTSERVVRVKDGKLTVRIFVDETGEIVAGISEIVFQQAN